MFSHSWKNKETGEINHIVNFSIGSSGHTIKYRDSSGVAYEISFDEFMGRFEPIEVDYYKYSTEIIEHCRDEYRLKIVLDSILRRYHPGGYFHTGDLVYITDLYNLFPTDSRRDGIFCRYGVDYPLKIYEIEKTENSRFTVYVDSVNRVITNSRNCNLKFSFDLTQVEPFDAYWMLHRYDQPY